MNPRRTVRLLVLALLTVASTACHFHRHRGGHCFSGWAPRCAPVHHCR